MQTTIAELKKIIAEEFPGATAMLRLESDNRIRGEGRSLEFKGKSDSERIRLISERVRQRLGQRGMNLGILYTAPGEQF